MIYFSKLVGFGKEEFVSLFACGGQLASKLVSPTVVTDFFSLEYLHFLALESGLKEAETQML